MQRGREIRVTPYRDESCVQLSVRGRPLSVCSPRPRAPVQRDWAGLNGREHIRVTLLEGRAAIHGVYDPNPGSVAARKRNNAHPARAKLVPTIRWKRPAATRRWTA